jgi:hypothetical protein
MPEGADPKPFRVTILVARFRTYYELALVAERIREDATLEEPVKGAPPFSKIIFCMSGFVDDIVFGKSAIIADAVIDVLTAKHMCATKEQLSMISPLAMNEHGIDFKKCAVYCADFNFIAMGAAEERHGGAYPELMLALCLVVLSCLAIGTCCTAFVCIVGAMVRVTLRGAKCGAEAIICVFFKCWRVCRWLWYFRRKIWRIHRVRFLALIIICAFSNPGWSKGGDTSLPDGADCLEAPPRVHDVYGHVMEMPMECFRRKTVRHDPFVGVCVGEALRPGPRSSAGDARALKFVESARRDPSCGFGLAEPPPGAIKPMKVVTANCTCWKSIRGFLEKPIPGVQAADRVAAGGADAVLVQEHHLLDHELAAVSVWCLANGWKSMWSPACSTEDGGTTSGVAILVKAEFGLIDRHVFEAAAHRGLAATFQYPGTPDVKLVCLYLESGSPLQGPSALLCGQV